MSWDQWLVVVVVAAGLLGMGAVVGWVWRDSIPDTHPRRMQVVVAVVFALIMAGYTADTISLQHRLRAHSEGQFACDNLMDNRRTVIANEEEKVDTAAAARADAFVAALQEAAQTGGIIDATNPKFVQLEDALKAEAAERRNMLAVTAANPLQEC